MGLQYVTQKDREFWFSLNPHGSPQAFQNHILTKTGYLLWEGGSPKGLLNYCLLWEQLPFLNLLLIAPGCRGQGFGAAAMALWEQDMKKQGFSMALTSTQADETAQHFYRRLGYVDCGGLVFHHTPLEQPLELFLYKTL